MNTRTFCSLSIIEVIKGNLANGVWETYGQTLMK